ncbi:MAG: ABC transporter permease [Actinobacteria bacterium]|nr:ABC transporter permease [Actinomycetota bacterium]
MATTDQLSEADPGSASSFLADGAFPVADRSRPENSLRVLLPQTLLQTQRLLLRLWRNPATILHALLLPVLFLFTLDIVLGDTVSTITGRSALYGSVPMVTIVGVFSGASVGAIGIMRERADGLMARLWVVPIHRASGLLSRMLAEVVRVFVTALVILAIGLVLGMRLEQGWLAALGWLSVPVIFGVAFACLVTTVALYVRITLLVETLTLVNSLGIFFCTGFVPLDQYPEWAQPIVEHQPMTYAVEAMRGMSVGGPVLQPFLAVVAWSVGIVAVCIVPMVIGYRRASRHN